MAKIKKAKKQARRRNLIELWNRHEPEEDKVMRALGETITPRNRALQRVLRASTEWPRFITHKTDRYMMEPCIFLTQRQMTWIQSFLPSMCGTIPNVIIIDELEEFDGRDNEGDVSDLLWAGVDASQDGDAEGS